jgi:hypothetical protein
MTPGSEVTLFWYAVPLYSECSITSTIMNLNPTMEPELSLSARIAAALANALWKIGYTTTLKVERLLQHLKLGIQVRTLH